ncbi:hypothetical protein COLO4_36927 [Corchorus olitorius]|uniref:Uncharacterized protein n=1 Tax=Corchorus olitorius TaxID=93759 RepID=A0A1R3G484_9ROSI|nr:hypothetical protein COLO4_36927 [Corchorus olitorius]
MIIKIRGNLPLDPLIPDLATIPRDHTCSSVDLTLTEPRFHFSISESSHPFGLVFEYVIHLVVLFQIPQTDLQSELSVTGNLRLQRKCVSMAERKSGEV